MALSLLFLSLSPWPDPGALRDLARRIDDHAEAARRRADHLSLSGTGTGWRGVAAQAFGLQADVVLGGLRSAAGQLEAAARALRRHADNVDDALAALTAAVRAGLATMEELLTLPSDALRSLCAGAMPELLGLAGATGAVAGAVGDAAGAVGGAVGDAAGAVGGAIGGAARGLGFG
jgi:hypothetical protein